MAVGKETVVVEFDGAVATVQLNRPDHHNTLNRLMLTELLEALEEIESRPDVRVVVLTGRGRSFSAGGDLSAGLLEVNGPPPLASQFRRLREFNRVASILHRGHFVSIASINGATAGAGLSLAMACDFRIASETAVFNTAFLSAGVSGDFGGAWFVTRIAGPAVARRLFFRPGKVSAARMADYQLVDDLVPSESLEEATRDLAQALLAMAPLALARLKRNLLDAQVKGLDDYLDGEALRHAECVASDDASEAANAFFERRTPVFTGA